MKFNQKILYKYAQFIIKVFPKFIKKIQLNNYELQIFIDSKGLLQFLFFLKNHTNSKFESLVEIAASDHPGKKQRFRLVYNLLSTHYNARIQVVTFVKELSILDSVTSVYNGASWQEREAWDMFGIVFQNHPDLRRILTDYGFKGHPLRKDFPLTGFIELFYDDSKKRILYVPVSLAQEYRNFTFNNPWNNFS